MEAKPVDGGWKIEITPDPRVSREQMGELVDRVHEVAIGVCCPFNVKTEGLRAS